MGVMLSFCVNPYDFWAKKLLQTMSGFRIDNESLMRIIVTRCEIDMDQIKNVFDKKYGNGKTLKDWIENSTSGQYKELLLLLCGYGDDHYYNPQQNRKFNL